jgi:hypothetical protein
MRSHNKGGRLYVPPVITISQDFLLGCSLALFGKLLFAFLSMNKYVVGRGVPFPPLSSFPVAAPIVKLKLVQVPREILG